MKLNEQELRQIIAEEFMRGMPEFLLHQVSDECIEKIRQYLQNFILLKSQNSRHATDMRDAANEVLKELHTEMHQLIMNKLWQFVQQH